MTTNRDFDQMARAWLDLMPDEAPDRLIANVRLAVDATPQMRGWRRLAFRRPNQMNRLSLIAAVAVIIAALVGGAVLLVGNKSGPSQPTAAPTPTTNPTPTTEPIVAFPEALWGLWLAEPGPIPGLPDQGPQTLALFDWDGGRAFSVGDFLQSDALASADGQFRLRARDDTHGCAHGDIGTYGWQRSANGMFLSVTLVDDPCAVRATTLTRTWVRTLGVANDGRTGMATFGDPYPYMQVTLSSTSWAMDALPPVDIHRTNGSDPGRDFIVYVNPMGLGDPCSKPGGQPFALDPTPKALTTYLRGLPGMGTMTSEAAAFDGRPATHITSTVGECPDPGTELALMTQPSFPGSNGGTEEVRAPKGMVLSLWAFVYNGDLVVIWYAGDNIPAAEEQAVINSIRITDSLPTP